MKIFLDDERPTPHGWKAARWPDQAISLLKTEGIEEISLDHDLGDDNRGTGYDVLLWIEEQVVFHKYQPPKITVHTSNPAARRRMLKAVEQIELLCL